MQLAKKTVIGVKAETTQGTAVAVTATDFILAEDVQWKPVGEMIDRNAERSSLDSLKSILGRYYVEVTFKTEVKASGSAGTAYAPLGAAIEACGFDESISAGVSVTYAPISSAPSANFLGPATSVSLEVYEDGLKHVVEGCVGNMKLVLVAGKIAFYEFTFRGEYAIPTDASPGTQTYLAALPPIVQSATLSLMGSAIVAENFEIDCGNEIAERPDFNSAAGINGFLITGRKPVGTLDPESQANVAAFPYWSKWTAGTEASTSIVVGATAGNITTITMPKTQIRELSYGDRNGMLVMPIGLQFNQSTGDDWIGIVQT